MRSTFNFSHSHNYRQSISYEHYGFFILQEYKVQVLTIICSYRNYYSTLAGYRIQLYCKIFADFSVSKKNIVFSSLESIAVYTMLVHSKLKSTQIIIIIIIQNMRSVIHIIFECVWYKHEFTRLNKDQE